MKNKKLISLIMVALIIALFMTALILKNTQANSSESNIASNDEFINEIDDTNEIQSASENITEETNIAQENIVLEGDTETAPEADAIQHDVVQKKEEPKQTTISTQEKKVESPKQVEQPKVTQTITKQETQVQEQPKQETKAEIKVQEPETPKCTDTRHRVCIVLMLIFLVDNIISFKIISNVNITSKKIKDNTEEITGEIAEEITEKVKAILEKKSALHRRLVHAFPEMKMRIREKIKNKIN